MRIIFNKDNSLREMANILKNVTGLSHNIWLDSSGNSRITKHHEPRLKVEVDNELIPVTIDKNNPTIKSNTNKKITKFSEIAKWIGKNYVTLMRHWNREIDDEQAIDELINGIPEDNKRDSIQVNGLGQLERISSNARKTTSIYKDTKDNHYLFIKGNNNSYLYTRLTPEESNNLRTKSTTIAISLSDILLAHLGDNQKDNFHILIGNIIRDFDLEKDDKFLPSEGEMIFVAEMFRLINERLKFDISEDFYQGYKTGYLRELKNFYLNFEL